MGKKISQQMHVSDAKEHGPEIRTHEIRLQCPYDKEIFNYFLPTSIVESATRFPTPALINHEDHFMVVYIDNTYKVRSVECTAVATPIQITKNYKEIPTSCPDGNLIRIGTRKSDNGTDYILLED